MLLAYVLIVQKYISILSHGICKKPQNIVDGTCSLPCHTQFIDCCCVLSYRCFSAIFADEKQRAPSSTKDYYDDVHEEKENFFSIAYWVSSFLVHACDT